MPCWRLYAENMAYKQTVCLSDLSNKKSVVSVCPGNEVNGVYCVTCLMLINKLALLEIVCRKHGIQTNGLPL